MVTGGMIDIVPELEYNPHKLYFLDKSDALTWVTVNSIHEHVNEIGIETFVMKYLDSISILRRVSIDVPEELVEARRLIKKL